MNIEIKKLTPELTKDYIDYFEKVAFTDNSEWSGCYCVFHHWNDRLEAERNEDLAAGGTTFNRELAVQYIQNGILQGYLAYSDGSVVGWCNTNDKSNYESLSKEKRPELWENVDLSEKVKLVVCFTIAPYMRGKGIATQLLNRVCAEFPCLLF